jgi:hypothetical protein
MCPVGLSVKDWVLTETTGNLFTAHAGLYFNDYFREALIQSRHLSNGYKGSKSTSHSALMFMWYIYTKCGNPFHNVS